MNFKAVFHKFYLVHSWILCPISLKFFKQLYMLQSKSLLNPYAVSFAINRLWGVQSKFLERLVDSAPTNKFLSKFKICFLSFWLGVGVFQVDLNDLQVSEFESKKLWFAKWKTDLPYFSCIILWVNPTECFQKIFCQ